MIFFCKKPQFHLLLVLFGSLALILCIPRPSIAKTLESSSDSTIFRISQSYVAGYGSFFSSMLWVEAMFNYADVLFDDGSSERLPSIIQQVAELDTLWYQPSLMAGWMIPDLPGFSAKDAIPFLSAGARRFPQKWQFRVTWAQYILESSEMDNDSARDSAFRVLLPLSALSDSIPMYARHLAFTLLHKSGRPSEAVEILAQTYGQIPDGLIRYQFQRKIGDLLWRNEVFLDTDSSAFVGGVGSMLDADPVQAGAAKALLIRLVQPETKDAALLEARHLARQFRSFQAAQLGTPQ